MIVSGSLKVWDAVVSSVIFVISVDGGARVEEEECGIDTLLRLKVPLRPSSECMYSDRVNKDKISNKKKYQMCRIRQQLDKGDGGTVVCRDMNRLLSLSKQNTR